MNIYILFRQLSHEKKKEFNSFLPAEKRKGFQTPSPPPAPSPSSPSSPPTAPSAAKGLKGLKGFSSSSPSPPPPPPPTPPPPSSSASFEARLEKRLWSPDVAMSTSEHAHARIL